MSSSIKHPSVPKTPPLVAEASVVHGDNHGSSPDGEDFKAHEVVEDDSICEDFLDQHLRTVPATFMLTDDMNGFIDEISEVGMVEGRSYQPAASLLTAISKQVFKYLSEKQNSAHRKRQHIRNGTPGHLSFIDHHTTTPTHFPKYGSVTDAPGLIGVYDVDLFQDGRDADGVYTRIPHHRVEGIVVAGPEKAATYAYRHHQARPDRPGFYVLVIKPQWYQVLYSDPTGVFASPRTLWPETDLLVAYIFSHYFPPARHFLWDDTIRWTEPDGPCFPPSWEITCDGKAYKDGQVIFVGEPWGRLTTAFNIEDPSGRRVIIKDCYRGTGRRFKEEDILDHIHAEGDFLGVVRMKFHESVMVGDDYLVFDLKGEEEERTRERWVLLDTGFRFLKARTVQDLLMAVYDTLEVHRCQLLLRSVLHRDMSSYNVLMYPIWGDADARKVNPNLPPTIQDVLAGSIRPVEKRFPLCLSIDYDNAALLDGDNVRPEDLKHRTGTPMYIARGVCLGVVFTQSWHHTAPRMPELSDEARTLYIRAYGEARYERYNDKNGTRHGGHPPDLDQKFNPPPQFYHRPEHDVESVYWSAVSALLRVHPKGVEKETQADKNMVSTWDILLSHDIPDRGYGSSDKRRNIIMQEEQEWEALFLDGMKDVGTLLSTLSLHVIPEYVLWGKGLPPDHLHEAVQRLILQFLVDHKEPIELEPDYLRPIREKRDAKWQHSQQISTMATGSGAVSPEQRRTRASARSSQTRVDADAQEGSSSKRDSVPVDVAQSASSSGTRVPDVPRLAIIDLKRKTSSHAGRSAKRMRDNAGRPQSTKEHSEDEA